MSSNFDSNYRKSSLWAFYFSRMATSLCPFSISLFLLLSLLVYRLPTVEVCRRGADGQQE